MEKQKIRIIKKQDEYSLEYQVGDIFTVDSTWYGGVNVTSKLGIPLSLGKEEYEVYEGDNGRPVDEYSYELGVIDCFCEMVASGLKTLAMSHPCDSKEERAAYLEEVGRICRKYEVMFYAEDEAFITDLFASELNEGKYNFLFFRTEETLRKYQGLKERQRALKAKGQYTREQSYELAKEFGRLLSYPDEGIERLIQKNPEYKNI